MGGFFKDASSAHSLWSIIGLVGSVYVLSLVLLMVLGRKGVSLVTISVGVIGILYQVVVNRGERFTQLVFGASVPGMYLGGLLTVCGILLAVFVAGCWTGALSVREGYKGRLGTNRHWVNAGYLALPVVVLGSSAVNWVTAIFTEELVFRGLVLRQLSQSMQPHAAILLASVVFGAWHGFLGRLAFAFCPRRSVAGLSGFAGHLPVPPNTTKRTSKHNQTQTLHNQSS